MSSNKSPVGPVEISAETMTPLRVHRFAANKSRNGATRFPHFQSPDSLILTPMFSARQLSCCFQQDSLVLKSKKIDSSVAQGTKKLIAILMARKQPSAQADCAVSYSLRVQSPQRHGRNERSAQQMSSLLRTHHCIQENRLFPLDYTQIK